MVGWKGRCEVHEKFSVDDILNARSQFPDVVVLAHPECSPEVVKAADFSGSTTQMLRFVEQTKSGRLLLLTECSMGDNIASRSPGREILRICSIRCPHMNEITLEETLDALRLERYEIDVPKDIQAKARIAIERMIAIG
jgi:quinolinate synthase